VLVGKAYVKYMTAQAAAYARDKLSVFEYPPGYRMTVQLLNRSVSLTLIVDSSSSGSDSSRHSHSSSSSSNNSNSQ